jgi:hypothetical protein
MRQWCHINNHAISFSIEQQLVPSKSVTGTYGYSTVIMFNNLALAHGQVTLATGNKKCSDKAISLYSLVLQLL